MNPFYIALFLLLFPEFCFSQSKIFDISEKGLNDNIESIRTEFIESADIKFKLKETKTFGDNQKVHKGVQT